MKHGIPMRLKGYRNRVIPLLSVGRWGLALVVIHEVSDRADSETSHPAGREASPQPTNLPGERA